MLDRSRYACITKLQDRDNYISYSLYDNIVSK